MLVKDFDEFLHSIIATLEGLGFQYAVGGSVASSRYGEPRSTFDVDISVRLPLEEANRFVTAFQELGCYAHLDAVADAFIHRQPFNVIDAESGYKVDIFPIDPDEPTALERSAMARRRREVYDPDTGAETYLYAPEDVILYKLEYYLSGRMDKHLRDIAAMLVVQGDALDFEYLEQWAARVGVAALWHTLLDEYHRRVRAEDPPE
jgi:hypothetical protein